MTQSQNIYAILFSKERNDFICVVALGRHEGIPILSFDYSMLKPGTYIELDYDERECLRDLMLANNLGYVDELKEFIPGIS